MTTNTSATATCDRCGLVVPIDFDPKAAEPTRIPDPWRNVTEYRADDTADFGGSDGFDLCLDCTEQFRAFLRNQTVESAPWRREAVTA